MTVKELIAELQELPEYLTVMNCRITEKDEQFHMEEIGKAEQITAATGDVLVIIHPGFVLDDGEDTDLN